MATKKKASKVKPFPRCSMKHWDCIHCNDQGKCTLLTDMEVVEKYHHCGFFKKRNQAL